MPFLFSIYFLVIKVRVCLSQVKGLKGFKESGKWQAGKELPLIMRFRVLLSKLLLRQRSLGAAEYTPSLRFGQQFMCKG